jgi:hypothetical protein
LDLRAGLFTGPADARRELSLTPAAIDHWQPAPDGVPPEIPRREERASE